MQMMTAAQLAEFEVLRAAVLECKAIEKEEKDAARSAEEIAKAATIKRLKAENAYDAFFRGLLADPAADEGEAE